MSDKRKVKDWTPYIFLIIPLVLYTIFVVFPTLYSAFISLHDWNGLTNTRVFVGLKNYIDVLKNDKIFRLSILNNVKWAILSEIIPILLGLVMAFIFSTDVPGFSFYRSCIFFPSILSISTIGLIWRWMYDPNLGLIQEILSKLSHGAIQFNWIADPTKTIYYLIIAGSWAYSGLCMILFMGGIKGIPVATLEAATLDGASKLQKVWYIMLPQMKNSMNVVLTFTLINSFKVFDLIYVMTAGGPGRMTNVMATWSYYSIFRYYDYGPGSAMAIMLAIILVFGSMAINKLVKLQKN